MTGADTPYRRFSTLLAAFLLAGTFVVGATAAWRIQSLLMKETLSGTYDAVNRHLQVFGLGEWLEKSAADGALHEHSHGGGEEYGASDTTGRAKIDSMVRMHFDLYDIRYAAIYDRTGTLRFSYLPAEVGTKVQPGDAVWFSQALSGASNADEGAQWQGRPAFRLMLPLIDQKTGPAPVGAVLLVRDLEPLLHTIRATQWLLAGVMGLLAAALFVALRRVFLSATVQITTKSAELEQALALVEATYDSTLNALTAALDYRDNETEGHSQRVTLYAVRLARELGLQGRDLVDLTRGALLHDVGKIGIPDAVLRKPGALAPEEWVLMRRHPVMGYEMLKEIEFLRSALPVVLHHHERFDGTGYPTGLAAGEIPLAARIFAVCDTLDAILSDRPYRAARSVAEARAEFVRCSGTQFDPAVVEAFLKVPDADWGAIRRAVVERRVAQAQVAVATAG